MEEDAQSPRTTENERRFLVANTDPVVGARGDRISQGYLWARDGYAVRVRLVAENPRWAGPRVDAEPAEPTSASFALKGPRQGHARLEVEQEMPIDHAVRLLELCSFTVTKVRVPVISEGEAWVVDMFEGQNSGLVIAEFEGSSVAVSAVRKPWWCGTEITDDSRYNNEDLARRPWSLWGPDGG